MWRERAVVAGLLAVGGIHVLPAVVAVLPDRMATAYGVRVDGADLALLLRHRAVLLGLVGAAAIAAALLPALRGAVVVGGLISVTSFVLLAAVTDGTGVETARVARIDVTAACVLVAVGVLLLTDPAS